MCGACPPSDQLGRLLEYWILKCSWRDASSNPASGQHLTKLVRSCLGVQLRHGGDHVDFDGGLRFGSRTLLCSLFNVGSQVRLIPSRSRGARLGSCRRLSGAQRSPPSATPAPWGTRASAARFQPACLNRCPRPPCDLHRLLPAAQFVSLPRSPSRRCSAACWASPVEVLL